MNGLVLCHSSVPHEAAQRAATGGRWIYLAPEYSASVGWARALGGAAERVPSAPLVAAAAAELREPFLDALTELGRRHDGTAWWISRVSERNTMVSPLFLDACYLHAAGAAAAADAGAGPLLVVSSRWPLLEALGELDPSATWLRRPSRARRRARTLAARGSRLATFARRRAVERLTTGPDTLREDDSRPRVLLRTWVDGGSLAGPDGFRDRYWAGLPDYLERHGFAVATIPVFENLPASQRRAWNVLRASAREFLSAGRRYRLSDYAFALRAAARSAALPPGPVTVAGLDVTTLVAAERERAAFDVGTLEAALWERLPLRLAREGLRPALLLDVFENLIDEKGLRLGMRRHMPGVPLVGYQHSTVPPLLLSHFLTAGEARFAPQPDAVVCDGRLARSVLVDGGLPAATVHVGPALRYGHLFDSPPPGRGTEVLVPLPLVLDAAAELLAKVVEALGERTELTVKVKPHPMAPVDAILPAAGLERLPDHFETVGGGMGEWLARAGAVVSVGSSALYESLAAGVPVVAVGRDAALDLNPLAWFDDLGRLHHSPAGIAAAVDQALGMSDAELDGLRQRAAEVLRETFEPVTDAALEVFLDAAGYATGAPANARTASTT